MAFEVSSPKFQLTEALPRRLSLSLLVLAMFLLVGCTPEVDTPDSADPRDSGLTFGEAFSPSISVFGVMGAVIENGNPHAECLKGTVFLDARRDNAEIFRTGTILESMPQPADRVMASCTSIDPETGALMMRHAIGGVSRHGHVFTIRNDGDGPLSVERVEVPPGFLLEVRPRSVVPPGESTEFRMRIDTESPGEDFGFVRIFSNDGRQNPYTFAIERVGLRSFSPIGIYGYGERIETDSPALGEILGHHTNFGAVSLYSEDPLLTERRFTLRNESMRVLQNGSISVSEGFFLELDAPPARLLLVPHMATVNFRVRLDTSVLGERSGEVRIEFPSTQSEPAILTFTVQGEVVELQPPRIVVLGNNRSILNGNLNPEPEYHTDFGVVPVGAPAEARMFTVRNGGDLPLTIENVQVPNGFLLVTSPEESVEPGETAIFEIRLNTDHPGVWDGTVSFGHNAINQVPFVFGIRGEVEEPGEE